MDDGKKQKVPIICEEDYFETEGSTDGESEDLDDLILKAENSQHLWLSSDSDEIPLDVGLLQKKLQQKDEGLSLTAKIGKKLLLNSNKLAIQNQELKSQIQDLREELTQLKYMQNSRAKSFQYYEESEDEIDEGTCCKNLSINSSGTFGSSNNNSISLYTSLEENITRRHQIEQLQLNNMALRDEVKALQNQASEDINRMQEHYNKEFLNTRKLIGSLEKRIETGENRFAMFEQDTKVWKDSVEALAAKCNLHELEIDELQGELSKIKIEQEEEKKIVLQLKTENEELKELIVDLKFRVHQMEQTHQPKVLRHIADSSSPYVESKSFNQELEHSLIEENKDRRLSKYVCHQPTYSPFINHMSSHTENFFLRLRDFFMVNTTLKLGQPGRPGSTDLDLAVAGINLRQPLITLTQTNNFSSCWTTPSFCDLNNQTEKHLVTSGPSCSIHHSRLLQNWSRLGTPDMSTIFRKQSGVWIKGAAVSDIFIEENFADLETVEDDYGRNKKSVKNSPRNRSVCSLGVTTTVFTATPNECISSRSKFFMKDDSIFIDNHHSLDDINKYKYKKTFSQHKSISLTDVSKNLSSLGLGCLWNDDVVSCVSIDGNDADNESSSLTNLVKIRSDI